MYPHSFKTNCSFQDILHTLENVKSGEHIEDIKYSCQCRVMTIRKASSSLYFLTTSIINGENLVNNKLQIAIAKQYVINPELLSDASRLGMGNIIGVDGFLGRTKTSEPTLFANNFILLAPCLHELPKEWNSVSDVETRFRQRYLDLIMNTSSRSNLIKRSQTIRFIREYLDQNGFMEVETPILNISYGGANAKPFITTHNDYGINMYMRIAPELYLKQLVVGGFCKVFEIGKQFRNECADRTHNPEFTSLELYQTPGDCNTMMRLCRDLIMRTVWTLNGSYVIEYNKVSLDFSAEFKQIDFVEHLQMKTGYEFDFDNPELELDLVNLLKQHSIQCSEPKTIPKMLDKLAGRFIEPECIQPTFVINHPQIMSPLAKPHRSRPHLTERFELFICGHEYANAYTELNDPNIQKEMFQRQNTDKANGDDEAQPIDMDFVRALEYGLPPTGGLGIGIDRLVMLITRQDNIREILCFPTMKPN